MQYRYLRQSSSNDSLLLFFNGWGMASLGSADIFDRGWGVLASELIGPAYNSPDIMEFFDYNQLNCDLDVQALCQRYKQVWLLSWSFGVPAALLVLPTGLSLTRAIAVNGTPDPISEVYGISPAIAQGTLTNWSETSRSSFNRRICQGRRQLAHFEYLQPQRDILSQCSELAFLLSVFSEVSHSDDYADIYDLVLIGEQDRIFLPERQLAYWQNTSASVIVRNCPHWPISQPDD